MTIMNEMSNYDKLAEQEIKKIVEANVDIADEDVIQQMDKWNTSIYWYNEQSGRPRADGTTYYPRVVPVKTREQISKWHNEIIVIATKYRTFDKKFKKFVDNWNPNPYKFAKAVSKLFFNIYNNEEALENVRKHFANIQYNMRK